MRKMEEEGRKAWLQRDGNGGAGAGVGIAGEGEKLGADGKNFGVRVGRSGGGV